MRFVGGKEPVYMSKVTMFVKSALVDIASYSPSRETAAQPRPVCRRDAGRGHSATAIKS